MYTTVGMKRCCAKIPSKPKPTFHAGCGTLNKLKNLVWKSFLRLDSDAKAAIVQNANDVATRNKMGRHLSFIALEGPQSRKNPMELENHTSKN